MSADGDRRCVCYFELHCCLHRFSLLIMTLIFLCLSSNTARLLPVVYTALSHPFVSVRVAACHCARSLSRAMRSVRALMIEAEFVPRLMSVCVGLFCPWCVG